MWPIADQNALATRDEILLALDVAFYRALEAQATLQVAQSTVAARSSVNEQVGALTASKLRSTLDQSFAQVNLSQAQLLALDAQNQAQAALAVQFHQFAASTAANDKERADLPELLLQEGGSGIDSLRRQYSKPLFVLMTMVALILAIQQIWPALSRRVRRNGTAGSDAASQTR